VVCDMDDFKVLNEMFGHLVGDEILRGVGHLLSKSVRDEDLAFRWGGDEFVIFFRTLDQPLVESRMLGIEERLKTFHIRQHGETTIGSVGASRQPAAARCATAWRMPTGGCTNPSARGAWSACREGAGEILDGATPSEDGVESHGQKEGTGVRGASEVFLRGRTEGGGAAGSRHGPEAVPPGGRTGGPPAVARLAETELVFVRDAVRGENDACSVMGMLGEVFAVTVYLGAEGSTSFRSCKGRSASAREISLPDSARSRWSTCRERS